VHETVNILLVDNEPGGVLALEAILEPLGQKLIAARSGHEALRQLLAHDFALILLDVQMPDLDGFQTAALIRERERSRHTPIIFLTASYESEAQVFRGYAVGAVDYVFKPLQPEILLSKVSAFVELARTTEVGAQAGSAARSRKQGT
jgi:CheY-like chemotaxis protein